MTGATQSKIIKLLEPLKLTIDRINLGSTSVTSIIDTYVLKYEIDGKNCIVHMILDSGGRCYATYGRKRLKTALFEEVKEFRITNFTSVDDIFYSSDNDIGSIANPYLGCKTWEEAFIKIDLLGSNISKTRMFLKKDSQS